MRVHKEKSNPDSKVQDISDVTPMKYLDALSEERKACDDSFPSFYKYRRENKIIF